PKAYPYFILKARLQICSEACRWLLGHRCRPRAAPHPPGRDWRPRERPGLRHPGSPGLADKIAGVRVDWKKRDRPGGPGNGHEPKVTEWGSAWRTVWVPARLDLRPLERLHITATILPRKITCFPLSDGRRAPPAKD